MRKFIFAIAILIGIVFLLFNQAELGSIVDTLQQADLRYILMALAVEALYMLNVAGSYHSVYSALGLKEQIDRLILMAASANFVNVVAPSGGVGGLGIFMFLSRGSWEFWRGLILRGRRSMTGRRFW